MKNVALILLVVVFFALSAESGARSSFEQRRQRLIEVVSGERDRSFFSVTAKLITGKDRDFAIQMLDSLTTDQSIGGMFYSYAAIGSYLRLRDQLPDSLRAKMRNSFRERTMYRGDTENHWVMYYTGLYLAAQTWPN